MVAVVSARAEAWSVRSVAKSRRRKSLRRFPRAAHSSARPSRRRPRAPALPSFLPPPPPSYRGHGREHAELRGSRVQPRAAHARHGRRVPRARRSVVVRAPRGAGDRPVRGAARGDPPPDPRADGSRAVGRDDVAPASARVDAAQGAHRRARGVGRAPRVARERGGTRAPRGERVHVDAAQPVHARDDRARELAAAGGYHSARR